MKGMVVPVIELIWKKMVESFSSRVAEHTVDNALNSVHNINDFELIFKNLKKNLKSLSAKAADVEEETRNRERSGRKKRKREVKEWLEEVESIEQEVVELGSQIESEGFVMRLTDGGKAEQLDKQVEKLVEQSRNFGELVLDVYGTRGDAFLTDGMVGEAFSVNLERITKLIENREVSSIGVHGMGGVGKTTLAKHVNNRLLQQAEGRVLWVTVSQEFTIKILQDKLAHLLGVDLSEKDEDDVRAKRLHDALSQEKNSVLILDDAWEYIDMKKVGCYFPVDGCRVIVTTRSLEVCHQMRCERVIQVEKLGEEEAWKLFSETLGDEIKLGPEVEGVAKSVAKMCDGLPLGIITMAGSMRGEKVIHSWKNALMGLEESVVGQDGMGDIEVFKVLKYSFDRLKSNGELESSGFNMIQQCFLYCSLYPEDHKIFRHDLVKRFISDGLVGGKRSRRAQVEQGLTILDKLVKLCLLESCVNIKNKECVKMHDLVRSMALKICEGKYLVRVGEQSLKEILDEEEWSNLEKVSLIGCDMRRIGEGFSPDCPKLSTLLLWENRELKVILESFFSKMQGLCTLDLSWNSEIAMLPDSISDLACLKSLILEGCRMLKSVPYLGKMKALRELNLSDTCIEDVPQGLGELLNLRFLSMYAPELKMLPRGLLLKLVHLEHLSIPLYMQVSTEEIKNLKRLEEFGGGVKSVSDFNLFVRSRAHDVTCYRIGVSKKDVESATYIMEWAKWPKASNNNELELHDCDLKDEKVLGKGIGFLRIKRCEGVSKWFVDDLWERFDNPTTLKRLIISKYRGIEWIMRSEDCQLSSTLEEIRLKGLDDLKGVVGVMERERGGIGIGIGATAAVAQPPVFPSLKWLEISKCNKMKKLGLPISAFPNLEEMKIWKCGEVEEIFEKEKEDEGRDYATTLPKSKLRELRLVHLPRLRKMGLPAASGVPNLEVIQIMFCGEIQEIFEKEKEDKGRDSVTTLPQLIELELYKLPRLRKVGLPAALGVPNLERIKIESCGEIQEIFEDEGRAADSIVTILPKLTRLDLWNLPRLERISKATIISNSIEEIWITECPELKNGLPLHFDGPVPPPSLEHIWVEREWWESLEWDNPLLPQLLHPFLRVPRE